MVSEKDWKVVDAALRNLPGEASLIDTRRLGMVLLEKLVFSDEIEVR